MTNGLYDTSLIIKSDNAVMTAKEYFSVIEEMTEEWLNKLDDVSAILVFHNMMEPESRDKLLNMDCRLVESSPEMYDKYKAI